MRTGRVDRTSRSQANVFQLQSCKGSGKAPRKSVGRMTLKTSRPREWDRQAASWDSGIHSPTWPHYHYYRTFDLYLPMSLGGRKRVLELGCGTGDSVPASSTRVDELWAFDFSREMVRAAQRKLDGANFGKNVHLLVAHALSLPFRDASFNGAYSRGALVNYVADPRALFSEVRRVLQQGGEFLFDMIRGRPGGEAMLYSNDQIGGMLRDAGFDRIEFRPLGMFLNLPTGSDLREFADKNRDTFSRIEIKMADCFKLEKAVMVLISAIAT